MKLALFVVVMLAACSHGEQLKKTKHGGVIALKNAEGDTNHDNAMKDAEKKMDKHCGEGNWEITNEERVPIGESRQVTGNGGYATSTSTAVTEWQITYRCGS